MDSMHEADNLNNIGEETVTIKTEQNGSRSLGLQDLYKAAFSQEEIKDEPNKSFEYYPMKQVELSNAAECYTTVAPVVAYGTYDGTVTNSVLDLDKGVQIVKVPGDQYHSFTCDSQILQRYLADTTLLKNEGSTSSESFLYMQKPYAENNSLGEQDKSKIKFEDCDFNSSDSFASTESIIPKSIQCPKCPKKFMFKSDLTRHNRHKHAVKSKLSCQHCGKEFTNQQTLSFHEKSHKKPKSNHTCSLCGKEFKKLSCLNKHLESCQNNWVKELYPCSQCSEAFAKKTTLDNHYKEMHTLKPFVCEICGRSFEKKQGLTYHVKMHSHVDEQVQCDLCGKQFNKASSLKLHMKVHDVWPKSQSTLETVDSNALKSEISDMVLVPDSNQSSPVQNNGQLKHVCQLCGKAFSLPSRLKRHMQTHNPQPRPCQECSQVFISSAALRTHVKKVHSKTRAEDTFIRTTKTQETCTQTGEDLVPLQNVNIVVDPNLPLPESIVLTPVGGYNTLPLIITQPQVPYVPYSIAS